MKTLALFMTLVFLAGCASQESRPSTSRAERDARIRKHVACTAARNCNTN